MITLNKKEAKLVRDLIKLHRTDFEDMVAIETGDGSGKPIDSLLKKLSK